MATAGEFAVGSSVACSDGDCGELRRVVVDPVARTLTHLVVEPRDGRGPSRLVPVDLVESAGHEIRLRCSMSELGALEPAEETRFLQGAPGEWGYGQGDMLAWPYFGLGVGGTYGMGLGAPAAGPHEVSVDTVPAGEVDVRRGEHVHATDGEIGRVQGLVVDPRDHRVTHVLLEEGHLWGKKDVAIPIGAVTGVDDGVRLSLSKDEVRDLPEVELARDE